MHPDTVNLYPLGHTETLAWVRLLGIPGIGRRSVRRLLQVWDSPEAVLGQSPAQLAHHLSPDQVRALTHPSPLQLARAEATWTWLQSPPATDDHATRLLLPLSHPLYPAALLHSPDPPLLLYAQGQMSVLQHPMLAMVGSRNASALALQTTRNLAEQASHSGLCVVSGLASGVDAAAHEGALQGRGRTLAVLGSGIDRVYPPEHRQLSARIARSGLLLSEWPLGLGARGHQFPERNRIIAGLSLGVLVVEAGLPSGSLLTAMMAADIGREVMAMPGSVHSPHARGCHHLLKQGAQLIENFEDICAALHPMAKITPAPSSKTAPTSLPTHLQTLWLSLGFEPRAFDDLLHALRMDAADLSASLWDLELRGRVARLAGGRYQALL